MDEDKRCKRWRKRNVSRTVKMFPQYFKYFSNANLIRARRLWAARDEYKNVSYTEKSIESPHSISRNTRYGLERVLMKAKSNRGRRRQAWCDAIQREIFNAFDCLSKLGVEFCSETLCMLAVDVLQRTPNEAYSANMLHFMSYLSLYTKIVRHWVQSFMNGFQIVS